MGLMHQLPRFADPLPGGKLMVNAVDYVCNWARANSLWPLTYGTSCCAIEMMAACMPRYDISRFGSEVFRASPRQADLILLAGTITEKMVEPLLTLYDQLPGSKYVIAMGACTINGGPFYYDNYTVVKGADRIIPVDVYIPGCPPRPEALFHGLMTLQEKIKKESIRNPWRPGPIHVTPAEDRWGKTAKAWEAAEKQKDLEQAEARAKFKAENPDYQGFKPVRLPPDPNPDLKRTPGKGVGLANGELWDLVHAAFPQVGLHRITEPDRAKVDALPADVPLDFVVPPDQYLAFANFARSHEQLNMELLLDVTAVDWLDHFDLVVHLLNIQRGHKLFFRVPLAKRALPAAEQATAILATVPTLSPIWPAAILREREVLDLFGIGFDGHPDPRRLFLPDDFPGHPLRKDFAHPNMIKRAY